MGEPARVADLLRHIFFNHTICISSTSSRLPLQPVLVRVSCCHGRVACKFRAQIEDRAVEAATLDRTTWHIGTEHTMLQHFGVSLLREPSTRTQRGRGRRLVAVAVVAEHTSALHVAKHTTL